METITAIKLGHGARRAAAVAAALLVIGILTVSAKWAFANMFSLGADEVEMAELAVSLGPEDPQTHYSAAIAYEKTFLAEDQVRSLREYETAAALSPSNYLLWLELARSRERSGDLPGAEAAFRRAAALAPNYSAVRWALGNSLVRQGKVEEGFTEIHRAVEGDVKFARPAVAIALGIFEDNVSAVRRAIGNSPSINSALAVALLHRKQYDEAFEVWNSISPAAADSNQEQFRAELFSGMIEGKKFRYAARLDMGADEIRPGEIRSPGFESGIKLESAGIFEWQIEGGSHPQIVLSNGQRRSGDFSLWLLFNSSDGRQFRRVSQTVLVNAGRSYSFQAFYKSELKTAETMVWEIVDAASGNVLARTQAIAAQSDWAALTARFSPPEGCEAVVIRLVRENCSGVICPIAGRVWFDDFVLKEE